jgi:MoxR-like ATPase
MEERQVTIDGVPHPLSDFFLVCATQNPIEFEGTYPLPEAQLDRFLLRATTDYPDATQERELLSRSAHGFDARDLGTAGISRVATRAEVLTARREIRSIFVADSLRDYLYEIVRRTRTTNELTLGASPRAGLALLAASQAAAGIENRDFVTPDDVKAMAPLVLPHRLIVRPEAEVEGLTASAILDRILAGIEVPRATPSGT